MGQDKCGKYEYDRTHRIIPHSPRLRHAPGIFGTSYSGETRYPDPVDTLEPSNVVHNL